MTNKFSNNDLENILLNNSNTRRTMQIFMSSSEISQITDD